MFFNSEVKTFHTLIFVYTYNFHRMESSVREGFHSRPKKNNKSCNETNSSLKIKIFSARGERDERQIMLQ